MSDEQMTEAAVGGLLTHQGEMVKPAPDLVAEVRMAFHRTGMAAIECAMVMIAERVQDIERRHEKGRENLLAFIEREGIPEVAEKVRAILAEIEG